MPWASVRISLKTNAQCLQKCINGGVSANKARVQVPNHWAFSNAIADAGKANCL